MEEEVSESVLRTLANEYCAKVLSKLVHGTTKEKLDVLELKVIKRLSVSEGSSNESISIRFAIEDNDVNEVLCTVSRYLDNQDVYWDGASFRIKDHDNKVNAVVEELRERINTLYKERYQSDFEKVSYLTLAPSEKTGKDEEFNDVLSLLTYSLKENVETTLSRLEKEHRVIGHCGLIHSINQFIDSNVEVQINHTSDYRSLDISIDYKLLDRESKPILMAKYNNRLATIYPNGTCKLNQEQVNSDLEDFVRKIKNEMLINLN